MAAGPRRLEPRVGAGGTLCNPSRLPLVSQSREDLLLACWPDCFLYSVGAGQGTHLLALLPLLLVGHEEGPPRCLPPPSAFLRHLEVLVPFRPFA
eukprot:5549681-Pyramimonas_sp.AAC.1